MKAKTRLTVLIIGILALGIGIFSLVSTRRMEEQYTASVSATLVDYREDEQMNDDTWDTVYYPIFSYEVDGKEYTETYSQCYSKKEFEVGQSVTLIFAPDEPENFWIEGDNRGTFVASWMIPAGVLLIAWSILMTLRRRVA